MPRKLLHSLHEHLRFCAGHFASSLPKEATLSHSLGNVQFKLDPWSASSLLQKSIRRGETTLAQKAAISFQRHRGQAVWRRLASIALEDVGIADPQLVGDAVRLATDQEARASRSPDLLNQLINRLAAAPKDRSADFIFCGATKLETAFEDRANFDTLSFAENLSMATADFEPLTRRAVAALSACTMLKTGRLVVSKEAAQEFSAAFPGVPKPLQNAAVAMTGQSSHPFGLMLLLVWSQYDFTGGASGHSKQPLPTAEYIGGIPLYTFDKHTAVGKKAISKLPEHSAELRAVLTRWVPKERWADVTLMAAFYLDAAPVAYRLEWFGSQLLEFVGFNADMVGAGCPMDGAQAVFECVRDNLPLLNELRREALLRHRQPL